MSTRLAFEVRGTGPRLVLVHGFTQTGASWGVIADDLARDHEVVLVDAPGHGHSSDIRADLPATGHLLAEVGGPATYLGYSMGGRMCLHAALAEPHAVRRLIVLGGTGGIDDAPERAARQAADGALAEHLEAIGVPSFLDEWLAQPMFEHLPDGDRSDRLANTEAGLASSLRLAGTGTQAPLWDALAALEVPVQLLAGERDTKFRALAERLATTIPGAEHAVVPAAGHAAHVENPSAFLALVRDFLTRRPPATT
jgi:2-succinyl-6-hydroxy-2,4-cyclohexadiene-1-carboxylate synthase